ncbi:hydroxymethylglutaryl-CoA lyase [Crenobacter cavernae]|uniref:hydroxymethylglutaryl-CoA lyase n=1 Tax=Crenobacter cavernae TaxID=2290923 RepID=A0A345Y7C5_9NEIS|nr:hydroxymethylglutaryl-CoA lyase [Crenobacter cavernae]AXK39827.1 hydroxymethylglutaryl-CoA lyase [Crenobacter cavernae]
MTAARVKLVEVGPRDGLQNEAVTLSVAERCALITRLAEAGFTTIEAGAFVSPDKIPQMADTAEVLAALDLKSPIAYPVLVPNDKGLSAALAAGAREISVFAAASDTFSLKNIGVTVDDSLARYEPVVRRALGAGLLVRGYVSCVAGCPYEGHVDPERVADVAGALWEMGCDEISLGDTIGTGTPNTILAVLDAVEDRVPVAQLAGHFHDTYGMASANVYAAWRAGVSTFDGSVAGLGGCPYARGAAGNVASEDLVWLFKGLGVETGVDLTRLIEVAYWISQRLGREPASRVARALAPH